MSDIQIARYFAMGSHRNQMYGEHPYVFHLDAVAAVLREVKVSTFSILHQAAYLHDVMEDCGITKETITELFGSMVAELVELVTDKPGKNRRERHELTYPLIALNRRATILKLADRVANVRASLNDPQRLKMYAKEYARFVELLMVSEDEQYPAERTLWGILAELMRGK